MCVTRTYWVEISPHSIILWITFKFYYICINTFNGGCIHLSLGSHTSHDGFVKVMNSSKIPALLLRSSFLHILFWRRHMQCSLSNVHSILTGSNWGFNICFATIANWIYSKKLQAGHEGNCPLLFSASRVIQSLNVLFPSSWNICYFCEQ